MRTYYQRPGVPAIRLQTVNVIVCSDDTIQTLQAFADNPKGNKRAEKLFRQKVEAFEKERTAIPSDEEDFENYLDDGVYDVYPGFTIFLTHSV